MMLRTWLVLIMLLGPVLAGCASSWQPAHVHLPYAWRGEPVELFFTRHGGPIETINRRTGRAIYKWRSPPNAVAIKLASETYRHPGERQAYRCELLIEANEYGEIDDIQVIGDGTGLWSTSSCNEMFGADPRHQRTAIF